MAKRVWSKKTVLREALLGLAHKLGPGARLPTVATLCQSLSVSNATLDVILRELEGQGAIVREHGRGIFVSSTIRQKSIGVVFGGDIFSSRFSPFWNLLLQAVREQAGAHHFLPRAYLNIAEGHDGLGGHAQLFEDLEARRLDGLLLLAPHYQYDEAAQLRGYEVPLVVFGGRGDGWRVAHDQGAFVRLAARELAARGHRRLALLAEPGLQPQLQSEVKRAGGLEPQIVDWSYETWAPILPGAGSHENCARLLTQRMLAATASSPLPEVLVSTEDTATRGVITALQQAGLQPGRDLRIVSAANLGSAVLEPYDNALVCLEFDPAASVRAALGMLETLMNGGRPEKTPVLIAPQSTAERGKHAAVQVNRGRP